MRPTPQKHSRTFYTYLNSKTARPFVPDRAMHITLRSRFAKGNRALTVTETHMWLKSYLPKTAERFQVRLYHFAVEGSHLHLVTTTKHREWLSAFLRVISGVIARRVMSAERGRPAGVRFWERRPYSRVLTWGREFRNVMNYVERNVRESLGHIPYIKRDQELPDAIRAKISVWMKERLTHGALLPLRL